MTRIISALLLALAATFSIAQEAAPIQLADNAPERHIVVPGDTLWGISAKFLKEPWRWPEVWRMNRDQIKNPHRIYPGDVIVLDRDANGNPTLRVAKDGKLSPRIYEEEISSAIPAIPPSVIEPFLSEPLIVEDETVRNGPRIVAVQEDRVFLGPGDKAFVAGAGSMPDQENWQIYRQGKPVADPETGETLGFEAFYLGTASQIQPGDPAIIRINTFKQEIGRGDRLIPAPRPQLSSYVPHKPEFAVEGRVASVYGGVGTAGKGSVITINRGTKHGIEHGHILTIWRNRSDTFLNTDTKQKETYVLPQEQYGLIFVFRTFDNISYALVLDASKAIAMNDYIRTP